jgi:hypothetical protein
MPVVLLVAFILGSAPIQAVAQQVVVSVDPGTITEPVTGRTFVCFTRNGAGEPREQAGSYDGSVPFFGIDVSALRAGERVTFDATAPGYPTKSLRDLPAGEYYVQALLNLYTKVTPEHGKTIWVPWDQWEGRLVGFTPGDLKSAVQKVNWDPSASTLSLELTQRIPPVDVPKDTPWVERVKIRSTLLSQWWGRPVSLGATVLLPRDWEVHPEERYPAIYIQGHFGLGAPFGFDPDAAPETADDRRARSKRTEREPGEEFARVDE